MKVINSIAKMSSYCRKAKLDGKKIGFVPTMGYLHEGHASLARRARKENDIVVLSIYVNPTQFGPKEDYKKYPRDFAHDRKIAEKEKVDVIFAPDNADMYPGGYKTYVEVEVLGDNLCGLSRPGHFKGVATVVAKLFNIVRPDRAYFGQKDAQQAAIIKRLAEDLNTGVEVVVMPTVREKDGLAMSSRNAYLDPEERKQAAYLSLALSSARDLYRKGGRRPSAMINLMKGIIKKINDSRIEYIKVVDTENLKDIPMINKKALIALAVFVGKTRLIDNAIIGK